ncbi:MAG: hypothetical protein J7500_14685 [Sphingomonas sp.]|uniref:hypothetical protein n=1 Tax=Sphingomonas sp. TaxID=28214 RepID=UPI001B17F8E8|nr:hypothetical protein [Sphingomonas sp.]MBO9623953.1 hypothetical protein [Sphingomonas sp.]
MTKTGSKIALLCSALFALNGVAQAQEVPQPSPLCHDVAIRCVNYYASLGYSSAVSCFDAEIAQIYCPTPPDSGQDDRVWMYYEGPIVLCYGRCYPQPID